MPYHYNHCLPLHQCSPIRYSLLTHSPSNFPYQPQTLTKPHLHIHVTKQQYHEEPSHWTHILAIAHKVTNKSCSSHSTLQAPLQCNPCTFHKSREIQPPKKHHPRINPQRHLYCPFYRKKTTPPHQCNMSTIKNHRCHRIEKSYQSSNNIHLRPQRQNAYLRATTFTIPHCSNHSSSPHSAHPNKHNNLGQALPKSSNTYTSYVATLQQCCSLDHSSLTQASSGSRTSSIHTQRNTHRGSHTKKNQFSSRILIRT